MSQKLDIVSFRKSFHRWFGVFNTYRSFIFFLLITSLYGYIVWRINVLSAAPPSTADVASAQQNAPLPRIPEATIQKLQGLQDNSVRVNTLFNQARQNPFQE